MDKIIELSELEEQYDAFEEFFSENEYRREQLKQIINDMIFDCLDIDEYNDFISWAEEQSKIHSC